MSSIDTPARIASASRYGTGRIGSGMMPCGTPLAIHIGQGGLMIDNVRDDISHKADTARSELGALVWLLRTAVLAAVGGAIYTELRKPPEQRTWHGKLLGVVPYDFRLPTLEGLRQAYW